MFFCCCCCSVAKSCPTLRLHGLQHARLLCPPLSSSVCPNSCTLSLWCYLAISSSAAPSLAFNFPSIKVFSNESALHIRWLNYWSFTICLSSEYAGLMSFRIDWFDLLAVQGIFKSPQFKSINSSAPSLLYGPTLTSIHDQWKNHNFDYMDLCWQSNISAF